MSKAPFPADALLTTREVADAFRVTPSAVRRWRKQGRLTSVDTPGGARRFRAAEVNRLLHGERENGPS